MHALHHRGAGHDDMNHISNGVWIGSHNVLKSAHFLTAKGIKNVINAAIEFITETPELINWEDLQRNGIEVHNTYWDDTMTQPIFPSASLETAVKKIDEVVKQGRPILVNCAVGKSRSTSLVVAYLMARQGMTYDQALQTCKRSRPICQPNPNFEKQLRQLESSLRQTDAPVPAEPPARRLSAPLSPRTPVSPVTPSTPTSAVSPPTGYTPPSQLYCSPYSGTGQGQNGMGSAAKPFSPSFGAGQSTMPRYPQQRNPGSPLVSPSSYSIPNHGEPKSPARVTPASPPVSPSLNNLNQRFGDTVSNRLPYGSPSYNDQRLASPRAGAPSPHIKSPYAAGTGSAAPPSSPFTSPYGRIGNGFGSPNSGPRAGPGLGSPSVGGSGVGPYGVGSPGARAGAPQLNYGAGAGRSGGSPFGSTAGRHGGLDNYMSPLQRRLSL